MSPRNRTPDQESAETSTAVAEPPAPETNGKARALPTGLDKGNGQPPLLPSAVSSIPSPRSPFSRAGRVAK